MCSRFIHCTYIIQVDVSFQLDEPFPPAWVEDDELGVGVKLELLSPLDFGVCVQPHELVRTAPLYFGLILLVGCFQHVDHWLAGFPLAEHNHTQHSLLLNY